MYFFNTRKRIYFSFLALAVVLIVFVSLGNIEGFAGSGFSNLISKSQLSNMTFLTENELNTNIFTNPSYITIKDNSPATPYPAEITVSGLSGTIADINVRLNGLGHLNPADVAVLLVAPDTNRRFVILSDCGESISYSNTTLTFDDQAATLAPCRTFSPNDPASSYLPTSNFGSDFFPLPAPQPSSSYSQPSPTGTATLNSTFGGTNPNGIWSLYVIDKSPAFSGFISGGYSLIITTTSPCSYSLTPTSQSFTASGGEGDINLITQEGCNYSSLSNDSFITINSGSSGNGNGTISYSVAANTGIARTGTVTIAGQTFTVTQASGCAYTLTPANINISANGGNDSFNVTSGTGCAFAAVSNNSFITITSGASGTGSGTVTFSVAANSGAARTGTITVEGQTFTISQSAIPTLTINNVSLNEGSSGTTTFNFTVTLSAASAQTVTVNYATADGTAVSPSDYQAKNDSLSFAPGETSKTITVLVNGDLDVEPDETFTVNLTNSVNATITNGTGTGTILNDDVCSYSISPANLSVNAAGGNNTLTVTTQAGCAYTAASSDSFISITAGANGTGSGTVSFAVAANSGAARNGRIFAAGQVITITQSAATVDALKTKFDFDGDGKADISVFRPDGGVWYLLNSASGFTGAQFGASTDKIVPADYDGDGKTDLAVYRGGTWYLNRSTAGFTGVAFGASDDIPQPADFDGDGKADLAVWRPSSGTWYVYNLVNGQFTAAQFGASTDKPVASDYDGDGKANYAVFRPSNGFWFIARPTGTASQNFDSIQLGIATDKPVPADYDGDGKTDVAVYRPSNGAWYVLQSTAGFTGVQFGISTDLPVAADYDGDGKADVAVYRSGVWYLLQTTAGFTGVQFGTATDKPAPNAFVPQN